MKIAYCLVLLLALTLIPDDVNGWFFRRVRLSFVRKIRVSPFHKAACSLACRWRTSWACKVCKRKRGIDVDVAEDKEEPQAEAEIFADLDVNQDGLVEINEIAKVIGLKENNPILAKDFKKADLRRDGKLTISEFKKFNFQNRKELMDALADDDDADSAGDVDEDQDNAEPQEEANIFSDLDLNKDGVLNINEVAKATGLKITNPILRKDFGKADINGNGKLDLSEFRIFNFKNRREFMDALADDDADDDAEDDNDVDNVA